MQYQSVAEAKSSLRQRLIASRNIESLSNQETVAEGFTTQLIEACRASGATTVACYLAFGSEPPTDGFLSWAATNGLRVMLPIAREDGELHWVFSYGKATSTGIFGFAEASGEPADLGVAELIFVPALAVDETGNRLGKGKGYYDRALIKNPGQSVLAVVYDTEVLAEVPSEPHDFKVDGFITQSRIFTVAN